jgi:hypothetical protein
MKMYEEVEAKLHVYSISDLVGGERSASCPGSFTLGKKPHVLIG